MKTTTKQTQKKTTNQTTKEQVCRQFYLERTRINELEALLKEGLYVDVDGMLAIGELVVFDINGQLCGVKKSPKTKQQASPALLKEKKVLTKWTELQRKAQLLQKDLDEVQDEIAKLEKGCTVPIENGYSIKTLENPKVE